MEIRRQSVFDTYRRHITQAVKNAQVDLFPFPHCLLRGFFPDGVYSDLLDALPPPQIDDPFDYRRFGRTQLDPEHLVRKPEQANSEVVAEYDAARQAA